MSQDLPACIKMEAGITLGLTVGSHADALTYFLQGEWASLGGEKKQTDRV